MTRRGVIRVWWRGEGRGGGQEGDVCVYVNLHKEKGLEEGNNRGLNCGGENGGKGSREKYMYILPKKR